MIPIYQVAVKWRQKCEALEAEHRPLHEFLETWGAHCGAPRAVFRGQLCRLLLDLGLVK